MASKSSLLSLTLLMCVAMVIAQPPFYQTFGGSVGRFQPSFQRFQSGSFVPMGSFGGGGGGGGPSRDYFGGVGGSMGLPVWGGAGIGERHANGLDRHGRGLFPR